VPITKGSEASESTHGGGLRPGRVDMRWFSELVWARRLVTLAVLVGVVTVAELVVLKAQYGSGVEIQTSAGRLATLATQAPPTSPPTRPGGLGSRSSAPASPLVTPTTVPVAAAQAHDQEADTVTPTRESALARPTAIPTPVAAVSPSASSSAAAALLALVAEAEANLRSGELEGRVEYGSGAQSRAVVTFDLGGDVRPSRVHSVVT